MGWDDAHKLWPQLVPFAPPPWLGGPVEHA
jgi:hypothetical protein